MKKLILSLILACSAFAAQAMSYEQAREEARFLTDKMAYELNLNDQQYNDCFEINLDYLLSIRTADDVVYGNYLTYRNADLRHILFDWQWNLFATADYFLNPVTWLRGAWYFPIYRHYRVGYYYYDHPRVFWSYRGGHGRHYFYTGYYSSRRPHQWHGGFRGYDLGPAGHRGGHRGDYNRHHDNRGHQSHYGNRDNRDNHSHYGNRDNRDNRSNYGNRDNQDNHSHYGNRDNRDNRSNYGNRDNRDNRNNYGNRDSRDNRSNYGNRDQHHSGRSNYSGSHPAYNHESSTRTTVHGGSSRGGNRGGSSVGSSAGSSRSGSSHSGGSRRGSRGGR